MNKLKEHILLIMLLTIIMILFFSTKDSYAIIPNNSKYYDSIVGYAYEDIGEVGDEELPKLSDIIVNLYDLDGNFIKSTKTDENGKYEFRDLAVGKYTVGFTWGKVDEDEINNINNIEDAKKVQKLIKYNSQDYSPRYYTYDATTEDVQIILVIDRSGSMSGDRISKAKDLAKMIVQSLLEEQSLGSQVNIEMALVSFDSSASVDNELTTNSSELISNIENINSGGGTDILDALHTAVDDVQNFDKENRFLFFLSDGEDGNGEQVKNYISELLENNIYIYSLYIGEASNNVYQYFEETEFKNVSDGDLSDLIQDIVDEFVDFLQVSLGYEEVLEDENRKNEVNEYFSNIRYNNSVIFDAIEMNITNQNLSKFKKYAKLLTENTSMTGYSTKICKITEPRNEQSQVATFNGPCLRLRRRPEAKIQQVLSITEMKITATNGSVIGFKTGEINGNMPLVEYQDPNRLYGSKVELEYTLGVKNLTNIENNTYNKLSLFCYIPEGFSYSGIINVIEGKGKVSVVPVTVSNIEEVLSSYYVCGSENELKNTELYNEIVNDGKDAVIINIDFSDDLLQYEEYTILRFKVNKFLNGLDDSAYSEKVEVLQYANSDCRRMETIKINDLGTSLAYNLVAGNGGIEEDTQESSDIATIIPPTGKDKREHYIYIIIAVLLILSSYIIRKKKTL